MNSFSMKKVTKRISDFQLGPIDLDLEPGRVMGFVGPNGAGKTTTIRLLANIYQPDAGEISICGSRVNSRTSDWKMKMGYLGEFKSFYAGWTAEKNLQVHASFHKGFSMEYAKQLLDRLELSGAAKVKELSSGNIQKLGLIQVLARRPRLLLLDEPLSALDPLIRVEVLDVLREHMEDEDCSIFASTHVVITLQDFADQIVFINNGTIQAKYETEELQQGWRRMQLSVPNLPDNLPYVVSTKRDDHDVEIVTSDYAKTLAALSEKGLRPTTSVRMGLDEITVILLRGGQKC